MTNKELQQKIGDRLKASDNWALVNLGFYGWLHSEYLLPCDNISDAEIVDTVYDIVVTHFLPLNDFLLEFIELDGKKYVSMWWQPAFL